MTTYLSSPPQSIAQWFEILPFREDKGVREGKVKLFIIDTKHLVPGTKLIH